MNKYWSVVAFLGTIVIGLVSFVFLEQKENQSLFSNEQKQFNGGITNLLTDIRLELQRQTILSTELINVTTENKNNVKKIEYKLQSVETNINKIQTDFDKFRNIDYQKTITEIKDLKTRADIYWPETNERDLK